MFDILQKMWYIANMKLYLSLAILLELNKHEDPVPASQLAEKFEISTRSVYRYLDDLESAGIPTFTRLGRNGGIGIEKNFALEGLFLCKSDKVFIKKAIDEALPMDMRKYFYQKLSL